MSPWVALATIGALLLYLTVTINVGRARAKYKVSAPATTGNVDFERALRVQQNTLEQLAIFLPAMWLFASSCRRPSPPASGWSGSSAAPTTPGVTIRRPKSAALASALLS